MKIKTLIYTFIGIAVIFSLSGCVRGKYQAKMTKKGGSQETPRVVGSAVKQDASQMVAVVAPPVVPQIVAETPKPIVPQVPIKVVKPVDMLVEYDENGKLKEGHLKYYDKNKKLLAEENYTKGKKDGVFKNYYENGQLLLEETYKEGVQEGPFKQYYENGKVNSEGVCKNNRKIWFKEYDLDGKLISKG